MDERNLFLSRENAEIISKVEDGEDEVDEIFKKNRQLISEVKSHQKCALFDIVHNCDILCF